MDVNITVVSGRLVADPEITFTKNEKQCAKFTLACNPVKEKAYFFEVKCWEKTAQIVGQYLKKGSPVLVNGYLFQDSWVDTKTGQKRSKIGINASQVTFMSRGKKEEAAPEAPPPNNDNVEYIPPDYGEEEQPF